jgi:ATP-dependent DNA helicase PIF1
MFGLANGTRLIVKGILSRVIDAEIATGNREDIGQRVFIPRWSLIPSDVRLPFYLIRRQFPIRPAFAVTITKSQGQTMDRIGLYLPEHAFSHGQLYVALSRVGSPAHITILASKGHV